MHNISIYLESGQQTPVFTKPERNLCIWNQFLIYLGILWLSEKKHNFLLITDS